MKELLERARELGPYMTGLRRDLHRRPEVGFDLPLTRGRILAELERLSLSCSLVGKGAVSAHIGPKKGPYVLLRADCDALPVREETDLPFRSENGVMHACGHDLHVAALLGAAVLLREREETLSRGVRLLFQPAEELLSGALDAVEAGICEGVTSAYMLHVRTGTGLAPGTVILPPVGEIAPSADFFEIALQGKGCHGADPTAGRDPLAAAARILLSLEHLPAREFPSPARATLTVGCLQGGEGHNVIPDRALLRGSFRCFGEEFRARMKERISQVCRGVGEIHGVTGTLTFPVGCPSLRNDGDLHRRAKALFSAGLADRFFSVEEAAMGGGSEDFAVISRRVPSLMLALAAGDSPYPLHHPRVDFDESCLPYGAAALARLAME